MPIDLTDTIREGLNLLRTSLPESIVIRESFEVSDPVILGDALQIQQILLNFGANSAHAMRERGGEIRVLLKSVELDVVSGGTSQLGGPSLVELHALE